MSNRSHVYFVRPVGQDGPVKIGCTTRPRERLAELAIWSPVDLEVAATVPGDCRLERAIHNAFADLYERREWFRDDGRLTDAIRRLAAGEPVERVIDLNGTGYDRAKKAAHWAQSNPEAMRRAIYARRLRAAARKANRGRPHSYFTVPDDVEAIIDRWRGIGLAAPITPTPDELARIDEVLAHPLDHMPCHFNAFASKRAA